MLKELLLTGLIGCIAGAIDILPMIKMKLDKYSICSAFIFYFVLPFIISNIDLYGLAWWLQGGLLGFALALPTILIVAKHDQSSVPPMLFMSVLLGTLISAVHQFLIS